MDENLNQLNNVSPETQAPVEKSSVGTMIGIIVVILILIIGGLYFWDNTLKKSVVDKPTQELQTQSESTEIGDIEADLNATDPSSLDEGLGDIEQDLTI